MKTWYAKRIGNTRTGFGALNEIQQLFLTCYMASGQSSGVAVFVKYNIDMDEVTVFLTPESTSLADKLGATACEAPVPGIILVVGDRRAYEKYHRTLSGCVALAN
jgi:hypothetical protein